MSPTSPEALPLLKHAIELQEQSADGLVRVKRLLVCLIIVFVVGGAAISITFVRLRDSQERGNRAQACRSVYGSEVSESNGNISRLLIRTVVASVEDNEEAFPAIAKDARELDAQADVALRQYRAQLEQSVADPAAFLEECGNRPAP